MVIECGLNQQYFAYKPKGLHEPDLERIRLKTEQKYIKHFACKRRKVECSAGTSKGCVQCVRR